MKILRKNIYQNEKKRKWHSIIYFSISTYNVCKFWSSPIPDGMVPVIRAFLRDLWNRGIKNQLITNQCQNEKAAKHDEIWRKYTYKSVKFFKLITKSRDELTLYISLIRLQNQFKHHGYDSFFQRENERPRDCQKKIYSQGF